MMRTRSLKYLSNTLYETPHSSSAFDTTHDRYLDN